MHRAALIVLGLLSLTRVWAQQFEVASIRPSGPQSIRGTDGGPGSASPERWVFGKATLQDLIVEAYGIRHFQIISKIRLDNEIFDVAVKMPATTTKAQFRLMQQSPLAERFGLRTHIESKEFPAFEMVVAKSGHKLIESKEGTPFRNAPPQAEYPQLPQGRPAMSARMTSTAGFPVVHPAAQRQPLANLAMMLRPPEDRPIVERTRLTGTYDFTLEYYVEQVMQLWCSPVWPLVSHRDDTFFPVCCRSCRRMQRFPTTISDLACATLVEPLFPHVARLPADPELPAQLRHVRSCST